MLNKDNLQYIKGIGPQRLKALNEAGIHSIHDLLEFYPRRYLDRSNIIQLDNLQMDHEVTIIGKIEAAGIRQLRKRIFYLVISDGKGVLEALWFNQVDRFKKLFAVGDWISLSGKVTFYRGYQMVHPDFDRLGEGDLDSMINTGKILPLYPGSENFKSVGLNSYSLRRIMDSLLKNRLPEIEEDLPFTLCKSRQFPDRRTAYRNIHFPESKEFLERSRYRFIYEEFFYFELLLALQKRYMKKSEPGIAFEKRSNHLGLLYAKLPFNMTAAQKRVVREIRSDMKQAQPMNRLVQGDVGSGKTLVGLMAILIAFDNGYQAALMVPTEILAEQHFSNISRFLESMNIPVRLLTRNTSNAERSELKAELASHKPIIVIGTHALIQEDVDFSRLGLVIIDEQHRFGVMQRGALLEKGIHPDLLLMTATPIPRTLALTLYGSLDISLINEMPPGRTPVSTHWRFDDKENEIYNFVLKRLKEGEQAYIVFPLIEASEQSDLKAAKDSYEKLKNTVFKNTPVGLLHGRMAHKERESVMREFTTGKIKALVTTTVIEVGIDIPRATIMIIEHAERFGLSQLHQLRGRVGRGALKSYCILKTPYNIGDIAQQRMKIMCETNDGFRIAEDDLRLRGWGDFLGTRQHGMPEFKIANPITDHEILMQSREDAFKIIASDPLLLKKENQGVRKKLILNYNTRVKMLKIS